MKKAIIGRKVGMTQIFDEKGNVIPVTVIEAGPCSVVQVKTVETDGYDAVQLGFGSVKEHKVNKKTWTIKRTYGTWFYVSQKTRFNGIYINSR